jgi:hypothetical protein
MNGKKASALYAVALSVTFPLLLATPAPADPLPPPWQHADVGDVGIPGDATDGPSGFFVYGAGGDIWGTADSFHFLYQSMDHDGWILAVGPDQTSTNPFAKTGIMIRQSLDPGSPHVILDIKPDGGVEFMTRSAQDGPTTFIAGAKGPGALWLRRRAGLVTAVVCPFAAPSLCNVIGSAPFPSGPALAGGAVTSHDPTTLNRGLFHGGDFYVVQMPQEWSSNDVGATGLRGTAYVDGDTFTVKGAGADIWGAADSYYFVSKAADSTGQVVARVTSEDAANAFAKAGVIVTANSGTQSNSGNQTVILDIRPNGVIEFMARPTAGGNMQFIAGSAASLPVWLKIEGNGRGQFTGSMSNNGQDWQVVGIATLPGVGGDMHAGLAVTSHDTNALNTSTFDHVSVASLWIDSIDIGDVGIAGETVVANNGAGFLAQGGGADIWGTADAFHFFYRDMQDDGGYVVRVNSLDNTNQFAKVGLMIRDSPDPSAAHVLVDVTPSGLVEVLTRPSFGADTQWVGGRSSTGFPLWLKLTRSGQTVQTWASTDGSSWEHLADASPNLSSYALLGVATTSHVRGVVTSAIFDTFRPSP